MSFYSAGLEISDGVESSPDKPPDMYWHHSIHFCLLVDFLSISLSDTIWQTPCPVGCGDCDTHLPGGVVRCSFWALSAAWAHCGILQGCALCVYFTTAARIINNNSAISAKLGQSARQTGAPAPMRIEVADAEIDLLKERVMHDLNSVEKAKDQPRRRRAND